MDIISYRIYDENNNWFPVEFKFKKNAQKACDFFSKRDNEQYVVKKFYWLIGLPDYNDDLINQIP